MSISLNIYTSICKTLHIPNETFHAICYGISRQVVHTCFKLVVGLESLSRRVSTAEHHEKPWSLSYDALRQVFATVLFIRLVVFATNLLAF